MLQAAEPLNRPLRPGDVINGRFQYGKKGVGRNQGTEGSEQLKRASDLVS